MTGGTSRSVQAALAAARSHSGEVGRRWRAGPEVAALDTAFAACPPHDPAPAADAAEALLADEAWVGALLMPLIAALAENPCFEPPFKVSRDAVRIGALLYDGPVASITASVVRAEALAALPAPATVVIAGRVAVTRYGNASGALLARWRAPVATGDCTDTNVPWAERLPPRILCDAAVVRTDGRCEGQYLARAERDLVMLVATIRAGAEPLMREYATNDGRLVRIASADDGASRTEMLLAYLRRAGHPEAGERIAEATRDPAFHTRWAAMREWLAMDARAALPRLAEMAADDPSGDVRAAAGATLARVRQRIAEAEAATCPA